MNELPSRDLSETPLKPTSGEWQKQREALRRIVERVSTKYQAKFDESDLVQQTMLEACADLNEFRGRSESQLAGWLRRMLSRNLLDAVRRLRSHKRSIANELNINTSHSGSNGPAGIQVAAELTTASRQFSKSENLRCMGAAIEKLPASQREAITLHHLQGKTLAEVASQMQKSMPAVAGLLHRGLVAVKRELGDL